MVFANFNRPGVRVVETTAGSRILQLASFQSVYMFGSATGGTGIALTPTLCTSLTDFTTRFSGSGSANAVRLFFRNNRQGLLYFIRVAIATQFQIIVTAAATRNYTITINGQAVNAAILTGDTLTQARDKIITAINQATAVNGSVIAASSGSDRLTIRARDPLAAAPTVTTTEVNVTLSTTTPATPNAADYVQAIDTVFDPQDEWPQGFLIAPEAFQTFTTQSDRVAVASIMETQAASENFDWCAVVDCGPTTNTVALLTAEEALISSPRGHSSYYAPYLTDLEGQTVPPSPAIAGIATRRFREEGFMQPAAGAKYPIQGVLGVAVNFSNQDQEVLNPLGVNLVRNLRNLGVVSWAMRTQSADAFYRFNVTRVIMNVLNGTLRRGFSFDLFSSIDGQGVLLSRIEETARGVCRQLYRAKALFGATEQDAFEVVCSFENNTPDQLELGNVLVEIYAAPSPAIERILINTIRVPIGQVQAAAQAGRQLT